MCHHKPFKCIHKIFIVTPQRLTPLICFPVGASVKNLDDLRFLYENHEEFAALPSFYIIPGQMVGMFSGLVDNAIPGKTVDPTQVIGNDCYIVFIVLNT